MRGTTMSSAVLGLLSIHRGERLVLDVYILLAREIYVFVDKDQSTLEEVSSVAPCYLLY